MIYNQTYKVPVWVVVNTGNHADSEKIAKEFTAADARPVVWPAATFPITVSELGRKGWAHEVNQAFPLFMSVNFLMFAISKHLDANFGSTKRLSGNATQSYSTLNRKIECGDDYVRLFNDVLGLENDISLSYLFDIAKVCVENREKTRVFVTVGNVPIKLLQKVSDRVITVGDAGSDVVATGRDASEVATDAIQLVASLLGINK